MAKDSEDPLRPKEIKNRLWLAGKDHEPEIEVLRRCVDAMEREVLYSRAMPDELARALFMSTLDDCRHALDDAIMGATPQSVAEILDSLSGSLTLCELKAIRTERRSSN